MAIIQISRIQVRRGKEENGTGVPQLASGELGWAIDTQHLYIGNGSKAEGAPEVGNTRILTANDNILNLVGQYYYGAIFDEVGEFIQAAQGAVGRTLQKRLDDFVSAASFGVIGDGISDNTEQLQAAIDALFGINNQSTKSILYIPSGTYRITEPLRIPSYANIAGSGKENTIIVNDNIIDNGTVFQTIADIDDIDQDTQARYIKISDLSVNVVNGNSAALFLDSCRDSEFRNLKLSSINTIDAELQIAIQLESFSNNEQVACKNNIFENIEITDLVAGVGAEGKVSNNRFRNINFHNLEIGMVFGADAISTTDLNVIENCQFEDITNHAIHIIRGNYNTSRGNRFLNIGDIEENLTPVIEFGDTSDTSVPDTVGNISVNDYFQRTEILSNPLLLTAYLPEVQGRTRYENLHTLETVVASSISDTPIPVFRLPAVDAGTIIIDYIFTDESLPSEIRKGELTILLASEPNDIILEDEFTSSDSVNVGSLEFFAERNSDYIVISAKNNLTNSRLYYTIKTKT